jgi:hypothetical protein
MARGAVPFASTPLWLPGRVWRIHTGSRWTSAGTTRSPRAPEPCHPETTKPCHPERSAAKDMAPNVTARSSRITSPESTDQVCVSIATPHLTITLLNANIMTSVGGGAMSGAATTQLTSGRSPATIFLRAHATANMTLSVLTAPPRGVPRRHSVKPTSVPPASTAPHRAAQRHGAMLHHPHNAAQAQTHFAPLPSTAPHGASPSHGASLHHGCNTCNRLPIRKLYAVISASWCNSCACTTHTTRSSTKPTSPRCHPPHPMVHPRAMVQCCTMGATPATNCQYVTYN